LKTEKLGNKLQDVLREAGEAMLRMRRQGAIKGNWIGSQFKSKADCIIEKKIVDRLTKLTPNIPIVSEENRSSHKLIINGKYWLIDPIDGTASFCGGYNGYVTQAALINKKMPILAAVYAPTLNKMYFGQKNLGASVNGKSLEIKHKISSLTIIDNLPKPDGIAKFLYNTLPCQNYIESGSIGLKICRVAENEADLFVKTISLKMWDLAPAELILKESGGILTNFLGQTIRYNKGLDYNAGIIAAKSKYLFLKTLIKIQDRYQTS